MKTYVPDYYNDFRCLAGDCKHSCCIGWEVDIDEKTLEYYNSVDGDFGKRLQNSISYEGDTPHFCMDEKGRCPFLNESGLCDIMTNLGFDKVSNICDDHPRYRNFFSDRTEIGLGMSCEAVAMQILSKQDKTHLICLEDGSELLWEEECDFLDARDDILDILQNRELPFFNRLENVAKYCDIDVKKLDLCQLADIYTDLERLDTQWDIYLSQLKECDLAKEDYSAVKQKFETPLEQLAVYLVYRHLLDAFDEDHIAGCIQFIYSSCYIILSLWAIHNKKYGCLTMEDMAEICRMYSSEIEYSLENMQLLYNIFEN